MSDSFKSSFFSSLPNEVMIKILKNVDTVTLLNFCDVYECDYFLEDRNVVKNVELCRKYVLKDLSSLSKRIVCEYINTLNINCLYWITGGNIRKFLSKLVNLKTLYAIKTNLSLTSADVEALKKTKVEKLAVTVKKNDEVAFEQLPTVTTLYINFVRPSPLLTPLTLDMHFPHVTKLWVDLEEPTSAHPILSSLSPSNKCKIFCRINAPIPSINFECFGLQRYYNNRRSNQFYEMCCENFSSRHERKVVEKSGPWKIVDELHCPIPYGPRDAKRLYLNEETLESICFEELNFHHCEPTCVAKCREAEKQILKSPNAQSLKKLCLMTCLLHHKESTNSAKVQETSNGFKRKRIGVENSASYHSAGEMFENLPDLEHLEIFHCNQTYHRSVIQAYPLIAKFEKLRSLLIDIPVTIDGSFVIQVFKECKLLEHVKMNSLSQNEKLNMNLYTALPHAISLKDFRFNNHRIQLDKVIEALCTLKFQKLERIVLICSQIDKFSAGPLKDLLESNPQLTFLYFLVRDVPETALKMAQRTLNSYKKLHPSKVFFAKTSEIGDIGYPIPVVHFTEMMKYESSVSTLQAMEDFVSF